MNPKTVTVSTGAPKTRPTVGAAKKNPKSVTGAVIKTTKMSGKGASKHQKVAERTMKPGR
jgi:hypothetical protein